MDDALPKAPVSRLGVFGLGAAANLPTSAYADDLLLAEQLAAAPPPPEPIEVPVRRCTGCGARLVALYCTMCYHDPTAGPVLPVYVARDLRRPKTRWRATSMTFGVPMKLAVSAALVLILLGAWHLVSTCLQGALPLQIFMSVAYLVGVVPVLKSLWRRADFVEKSAHLGDRTTD